ncbi:hypothetical protein M0R45_016612 [Rubus argutus]|uniref:RecQ-mediated genome instability protein 2 n=1 Tax=Rubus argutus TaxID=59490 RepID=A0AAW1XWN5_RUBAR
MDYNLAAVKLLCVQLKDAIESPSENAMDLGGILFQRAWLQGILVSVSADGERFLLDDGTGVIELFLSAECRRRPWNIGMYIMAIGRYTVRNAEPPMIHIHKMVDLSASPDREAMWYLEVLEAYRFFYQPVIESPSHG